MVKKEHPDRSPSQSSVLQRGILATPGWGAITEAVAYFLFLAVQLLMISMGAISVDWLIRINTLFLLWLLFAAWKRFDGGMHICFLFIGMLSIFQAGRLIAFTLNPLFGNLPELAHPLLFVMMRNAPFDVSIKTEQMTMFAIVLSAICVYLPCSMKYRPARLHGPLPSAWMRGLYRVYLWTFPFLLYKDIRYFLFIRNHGGYMALFLMRDQILSSAGSLTRLLSLVASAAFVGIFLFENNRRRIYLVTFTYLVASALDLLIGMRGEVFTLLLTLWFIQNLKRGRRFRPLRIIIPALVLIYLAMIVANFRQNQAAKLLSPLGFVSQQGISMQVTEAVVGYKRQFVRDPFLYLVHEVEAPFVSKTQVRQPAGESLALDLTTYLSPSAAAEGFGTGSSYLAESYLFGGFIGVIAISLLIGYSLAWLHAHCQSIFGAALLAYFMPTLIYLPRSTLLEPIAVGVKTCVALIVVLPLLFVLMKFPRISVFGMKWLHVQEKTNNRTLGAI